MFYYSPENWITIIGGLVIFMMGLRVYYLDTSNKMYLAFLGTTSFLFFQNCFFVEMDNISSLELVQSLRVWQETIWNVAVVFIVITFWFYAKQFNSRDMKEWELQWLYIVLALSPVFIILQAFTSYGHGEMVWVKDDGWYLTIKAPDLIDYLRTIWTILIYTFSTYLAYLAAAASKFSKRRWVRWAIFSVFGLIMIVTFVQNYVLTIIFDQSVPINETANVLVGTLFTGLMIINLQFYDLQSEYAVPNLMKTMTNWFILVDDNMRIKQVNEAFLNNMGRNQKYWQNTSIDIVFGKENENWLKTKASIGLLQKNEYTSFEVKLRAKGDPIFLSFVITPIVENGFWKFGDTRQGFSIVGTDLSEFKQSEEQIRAYASDLETSNKALERFAYIASHDLKEPIRNIGNFAGLLKRRLPAKERAEVAEYIRFIEQNIDGMNKLIDAVLTVSRLGQEGFAFNSVNTGGIFKRVIKIINNSNPARKVNIEVDTLPPILGDEQLIYQLFQNLVENAVKYNKEDSPRVKITVEPAKNTDCCTFRIEDNGIGIEREYRKQVFEMFKRLHSRSDFEGTGIGLAICQRIVELHKGEIWIEDTRFFATGTAFLVSLPRFQDNR